MNAKLPVIEVEQVNLFQNGHPVLEDVNLTINEHEFHAIIGPNGGGKTTLLKVILGLIHPDSGMVRVMGGTPHEMRAHLGYVPQFRTFDFQFPISVENMVRSGRLGHLGSPFRRLSREDREAADEAMATMEITHLKDRPIHDISGGERQRAIIARALAGKPSVLLLDEPTVYVDSPTAGRFYDILSRLRESMTIVLVTHDISALSPDVTHISCVNRRLFTHHDNQITEDMIKGAYHCPVDIIAHGIPHRVIPDHDNRVFGGETMIEALGFEFFRNALIAGLLASIACGVIGSFVVVKRMASLAGGISHAAFGGIGMGYFLGIDPLAGAAAVALGTSAATAWIRMKAHQHLDTLVGAVWATGMAAGILFIYITPGFAPDLFSYLFGNILLVPRETLIIMTILTAGICGTVAILYPRLVAVTFDEEYASVMGLHPDRIMVILLLLTGLTVVMLIQIVGIILVIALLTLPAATARLFSNSMKTMIVSASLLGILFTTVGIWLSYAFDIPSGATIVIVSACVYFGALPLQRRVGGRRESI